MIITLMEKYTGQLGTQKREQRGVREIFLEERKTPQTLRAVGEIYHTDNNKMAFRKEGEKHVTWKS